MKTEIWSVDINVIFSSAFDSATLIFTIISQLISIQISSILEPTTAFSDRLLSIQSHFPPSESCTLLSQSPSAASLSQSMPRAFNFHTSSDTLISISNSIETFQIANLSTSLSFIALCQALQNQNTQLYILLQHVQNQIKQNYTQKKLIDFKNRQLKLRVYVKTEIKKKRKKKSSHPYHITDAKVLDGLAKIELKSYLKKIQNKTQPIFK